VDASYDDYNCSARLACRTGAGLPGAMLSFSWNSGYWVNSAVAKLVYGGVDSAKCAVVDAKHAFEAYAEGLLADASPKASSCFSAAASDDGDASKCVAMLDDVATAATKEATAR